MGAGTFTPNDWDRFKKVNSIDTTSAVNTFRRSAKPEFDPRGIQYRESCESKDKPEVTPIIIALDVTGSMGKIPELLIKGGLGDLMKNILTRASIPNPHVMFMAVGDVNYDESPLQVTQFEADIRIANQLKDLYLEGGGGSNNSESYPLAWYFAATRTQLDSFKNHQGKGILFTIGDEYAPDKIDAAHLTRFLGEANAKDITTSDILAKVQQYYDVFHLGIKQSASFTASVQHSWQELLGQCLIPVDDYTNVASIIVSTIDTLLAERKKMKESMRQHFASRVSALSVSSAPGGPSHSSSDAIIEEMPPTYLEATSSYRMG